MRASHIAVMAAVLAIPSIGYAQQDNGPVGGPVGGMVGPGGSSSLAPSPGQPRPSLGSPYGTPPTPGPRAGFSGSITPGQVVPREVVVTPRPGGMGSAWINGQRVLVDPNTNRIIRVFN
jgi:hypothetical protein